MGILDRLLGRKQKLPKVMSNQSKEDMIYVLEISAGLKHLVQLGMICESDLLKTTGVLESLVEEIVGRKVPDLPDLDPVDLAVHRESAELGKDAIYAIQLTNILRNLYVMSMSERERNLDVVSMSERDRLKTTMILEGLVKEFTEEK